MGFALLGLVDAVGFLERHLWAVTLVLVLALLACVWSL